MALSSNYRWVVAGSLLIRNRKDSPYCAPIFALDDLVNAIKGRFQAEDCFRMYAKQSRIMWCSDIDENKDFFHFIIHAGTKMLQAFLS